MSPNTKSIIAERRIPIFVIGVASGIIATSYFHGILSYLFYLIPVLIGHFSLTQKNALINGVFYGIGYFISFVLVAENNTYFLYALTFALLALVVGSLVGMALTYIGYSIRIMTRKKS